MKLTGIAALCLAVSLSGIYAAFVRRKRLQLLFDIADFFLELSGSVRLCCCDIIGIIDRISRRDVFRNLDFLSELLDENADGCNLKQLWRSCISRSASLRFIPTSAKNLLYSFCDYFGKLPPESFCEKCLLYSESFRKLAISENEKWEKNRSLIVSSGILCAAAVFFILI